MPVLKEVNQVVRYDSVRKASWVCKPHCKGSGGKAILEGCLEELTFWVKFLKNKLKKNWLESKVWQRWGGIKSTTLLRSVWVERARGEVVCGRSHRTDFENKRTGPGCINMWTSDRCVCDLGAEAEDNASLYWKRVASALPGGMEDIFGFAFSGEEVRRHWEEGAWDRNRLGRRWEVKVPMMEILLETGEVRRKAGRFRWKKRLLGAE